LKIRIFALARDLGLDSKVLIDLCEQAGVKLRNALATISEEERDTVVAYVRGKGTAVSTAAPPVDLTPVREVPLTGGKVRQIGGGPSRGVVRTQDEADEEFDQPEEAKTR
jgi:translation initiation factor IF-2